eukprot:422962_1
MEIQRLGINIEESILYVEYSKQNDHYLRKVKLNTELLSTDNTNKLIDMLKQNQKDLFQDNNILAIRMYLSKLVRSINDYRTEKILKAGTAEQVEAEKVKMNVAFEKNVINPSDSNYVYDKRISFEMNTNRQIPNDWDDDDNDLFKMSMKWKVL